MSFQVSVTDGLTADGNYVLDRALSAFTTALVGPTERTYVLTNLEPATHYQVEITASNRYGQSEPQTFIFRTERGGVLYAKFLWTKATKRRKNKQTREHIQALTFLNFRWHSLEMPFVLVKLL